MWFPFSLPAETRGREVTEPNHPSKVPHSFPIATVHWLDGTVIVVYLLGITLLGVHTGKQVKRSADFFMPRRFGKVMMIMHAFGTGTASDQAVTVASGTVRSGLSGIWYQWLWLLVTPFFWIIAPIMRRFRATTTADVFELRYDRSVSFLFSLVGILSMIAKIGLLLKGTGALIDAGTGGAIDANLAIVVTSVLFVTYGLAGGLGAAVVTDFIQGVLTLLFSFMLLPYVLAAAGGLSGVKATLAVDHPEKLSLVAPGEIGLFWILMVSIQVIVGIVALPSAMGNSAAGKTEMEGRLGYMTGTFIKRICTVAWCLTGIGALAWYIQQGVQLDTIHPDSVYGDMARQFLPVGLLGVFIASLLAGIMSSCDSFMISAAALFTENLYRPFRQNESIPHYLWVGRIGAVAIVIAGVVFAFWLSGVIAGLMIWLKILPMMGIAFWMGLLWRKATPAGAWASTLTAFAAWWLAERTFFAEWLYTLPFAEALHLTHGPADNLEMYEPWLIVFYMVCAIAAGIVVSLLSRPVEKERLDRYYQLTRTPIAEGEEIVTPCRLPDGVSPAHRKMLTTAFGLEIPMPSKVAVLGFTAGWIGVISLIASFVWIAT